MLGIDHTQTVTAFAGHRRIARGPLPEVAAAVAACGEDALVWSDRTGRVIDLDLRGGPAAVRERYTPEEAPRRGRPKLGVTAREVTLLPRHWDWLSAQPGGASATLRRLVEQARRAERAADVVPPSRKQATYEFLTAAAGDLPDFEEAMRALFADDLPAMEARMADWPADIIDQARHMLAYDDA